MWKNRLFNNARYIFSGIFFTGIFIFFAFFYNHHLHFEEQFQMVLLTWDYFLNKISFPGGFAGYAGAFLTQFYYISLAGPVIIVVILFALRHVTWNIFKKVNPEGILFPFSFLPPLLSAMILCNEFYPLSAIVGFLIALVASLAYISLPEKNKRFAAGILLIPATYWLAGGSFISLVLVMMAWEIILSFKSAGKKGRASDSNGVKPLAVWHLAAFAAAGAVVPLLVRRFLIMQPLMMTYLSEYYYNIRTTIPTAAIVLFILPALLIMFIFPVKVREKVRAPLMIAESVLFLLVCIWGFRSFANFSAEEIMTYDYLIRNQRWNDAIGYAEKRPPKNFLSLSMLNLSLAKTGQLGNRMFGFQQRGDNGLFLPFSKEYVAPMMGNEILYSLGFVNASQEYAFESMETIPNLGKSVRAVKRLAETNLINGQYKVSEKYLGLLEKTLFYKKWAIAAKGYLNNEEKINNDPDWGEKRRFAITNDYFFTIKNIEPSLAMMVRDHPDNRIAFEYLMAFYLLNKDLGNFLKLVPVMEKMNYREVPASYQEALMYVIGLKSSDPLANSPPYISQAIKARMRSYADIYTSYQDAGERLKKDYSGTYWYYLHFADAGKSGSSEEKK